MKPPAVNNQPARKPAHKQLKWRAALALLVVLIVGFFGWRVYRRAAAEEYKTVWSPDGNYRIVVYRMPTPFTMPGGSGDAPGYVRLYDKSGTVLKETDVEMVQLVDRVNWENGKVDIHLVAEWELPR